MKIGLGIDTSANCKSQLQFGQKNYYQLLYLTSTKYFQSTAIIGTRNAKAQPIYASGISGSTNLASFSKDSCHPK